MCREHLKRNCCWSGEVAAKIVKVDCDDRKIALSLWEHLKDLEQTEVEEFNSSQGTVDQSLGRVVQKKDQGNEGE